MASTIDFIEVLRDKEYNGVGVQIQQEFRSFNQNAAYFKFFDEVPVQDPSAFKKSFTYKGIKFSFDPYTNEFVDYLANKMKDPVPFDHYKLNYVGNYYIFVSEIPLTREVMVNAMVANDVLVKHDLTNLILIADTIKEKDLFIYPAILYRPVLQLVPVVTLTESRIKSLMEAPPEITDIHIVKELYGDGVSFKSNGKEYRISSDEYPAEQIIKKLEFLKQFGGRLWQWVNKHAVVYWSETKGSVAGEA